MWKGLETIQIHPCEVDYIRNRRITLFLGQEQNQMPRLISSLVQKRTMIGLFQKTNMMKNSRTGEDLYTFTDPQREKEDRGDMLQVCRLCQA